MGPNRNFKFGKVRKVAKGYLGKHLLRINKKKKFEQNIAKKKKILVPN